MNKRKICIVSGARAEYGLLYWLMKEIAADADLELQIVVTGMHLSPEFGLTYKVIEEDGFDITDKVEMLLSSDTPIGISKSIGMGVIGFADCFARLNPDIVVLLGDRFEILAAAQAAMIARTPIAHIHGGETTEGAFDEAIRHAITKMSHLHFVAADQYRNRVIQLGEQPEFVFNFGAPGLEHLLRTRLLTKTELEQSLDFELGSLNFLVTYHPETLSIATNQAIDALLKALEHFSEAKIIITKTNSDTDGRIINQRFEEFAKKHPNRIKVFTNLGQTRYLSTLQYIDVVIGNSSSGLIEVPLFKKPTVNIGDRQRGRLKATSVIDCKGTESDIILAIQDALSSRFQSKLENTISLYGSGNVATEIKKILSQVDLETILFKKFYDINES